MSKNRNHRPNHPQPKQGDHKTPGNWSSTLADFWPKESANPTPAPQKREIASGSNHSSSQTPPAVDSKLHQKIQQNLPLKKALEVISSRMPVKQATSAKEINSSSNPVSVNHHSPARQNQYADRLAQAQSRANSSNPRRETPIILGVDFGTSSTKVVWREVESDRAHALCFGKRAEVLENYLLPSVVAFDGDYFAAGLDTDEFLHTNPQASRFSNFKMCLACVSSEKKDCNPERCSLSHWRPLLTKTDYQSAAGSDSVIEKVSALYVGKVIALSKQLIIEDLRSRGIDPDIRWMVNMAAPVEHMSEQSVRQAFEKVLKIGEKMSQIFAEETGPRELFELLELYEAAKDQTAKHEMDCFVYPEIAAEVASMYLSRSARDGIYAFIDVGAGTVDASIFRLFSVGQEPQLGFYGASVVRYGAAQIESIAARQLAERSAPWFKSIKEKRTVIGSAEFLLPEEAGIYLKNACSWIENRVEAELRLMLKEAYQKDHGSKDWKNLHLLIGGGGATIPVYSAASIKAFGEIAENLSAEELPVPADFNLNGLPKQAFHRFAVAYGLSFNQVNLPDVALPDEISEHSREQGARVHRFNEAPTKDVC